MTETVSFDPGDVCFGVTVDGKSIGHYGDLSMFSFHATKLFHSIEGGMLMFSDPAQMKVFDYLKNFGFDGETEVVMPGTNAKMNEFQALMGLQVLGHMEGIISRRREIDALYRTKLNKIPGIHIPDLPSAKVKFNFSYFPVEIDAEQFGMDRDQLYSRMWTGFASSLNLFVPTTAAKEHRRKQCLPHARSLLLKSQDTTKP